MPLITDYENGSIRLNYLFNRLEVSQDNRATWSILFDNTDDQLGTIKGLTIHREKLFIVTTTGIYASHPENIDWNLVSPQRKNGDVIDIVSFENMLYACTNTTIYQAASGSRWRLKYDGKACGHFYALLAHKGVLLTACDKGVYVASQEGKFWHPRFSSQSVGRFLALDVRDDVLYAQTDKGYLVSTDDATHWQAQTKLEGPWTQAMGGTMLFAPRLSKKKTPNPL